FDLVDPELSEEVAARREVARRGRDPRRPERRRFERRRSDRGLRGTAAGEGRQESLRIADPPCRLPQEKPGPVGEDEQDRQQGDPAAHPLSAAGGEEKERQRKDQETRGLREPEDADRSPHLDRAPREGGERDRRPGRPPPRGQL